MGKSSRSARTKRVGAVLAGVVLTSSCWGGTATAQAIITTTPPAVTPPAATTSSIVAPSSVTLPVSTTVPTISLPPLTLPPTTTSTSTTPTTTGGGTGSTGSGGTFGDLDCPDFTSQPQAQAYFEAIGGSSANNADDLDRNHNGVACEDYPYGSTGAGRVTYTEVASVPTGGVDTGDGSFGAPTH